MIAIWTNQLSVGNRTIDSAHKHIFSILNRVGYYSGAGDGASVIETFNDLEDSLCVYFEVEEKIAHAINVDFTQHKLAHQTLLADLQYMRNISAEKNGMWSDREVESFTIPWVKRFVRHIMDEGKQMKVLLNTHYYDFQPD